MIKGYHGRSIPDAETTYIYFFITPNSDSGVISISGIRVNEYQVGTFNQGIRVLPGIQKVKFNYDYRSRTCDAAAEHCFPQNSLGECKISAATQAGHTYRVEIRGVSGASVFFIDEQAGRPIATAHC